MKLLTLASAAMNGALIRLRRDLLAYAVCTICAIAALIMATTASLLALEPQVGAVYARLIVGGVFVLIAFAIIIGMRLARPRPERATDPLGLRSAASEPQRDAQQQFAQIAMIVEALMLGFSLSRKSDRR